MRIRFELDDDQPFYLFIWGNNHDLIYPTPPLPPPQPKAKKVKITGEGRGGRGKKFTRARRYPRGQLRDCTLFSDTLFSEIYTSHRDEDKFLYITFGNEYPVSWATDANEQEQEQEQSKSFSFFGQLNRTEDSVPMISINE